MSLRGFSGIACVLVREDGVLLPRGTAFLISSRCVLTAFHVVENAEDGIELRFSTHSGPKQIVAREMIELRDEVHDCSVLRCEEPPPFDVEPIALRGSFRSRTWRTRGFLEGRNEYGLAIEGEIRDHAATDRGVRAIQLYSSDINGESARGLSGAPCLVKEAAVGVIRSAFSRIGGRTAAGALYATSIADIARELLPRLRRRPRDAAQRSEDRELRAALSSSLRPGAVSILRRATVFIVAAAFLLFASCMRVRLDVLGADERPAERVQVELRDCLRGWIEGGSDELGQIRFTVFRWCGNYELVLKNYGKSERKLLVKVRGASVSNEIACRIVDGRLTGCR